MRLVQSYKKQEIVKKIRLQDNALAKPSVPLLCEILGMCPYLTELNLNRNKLDEDACRELSAYLERIPGVTSVLRDPTRGDIIAKSGHQLRLTVNLEHQEPSDEAQGGSDPLAGEDLMEDPSGAQADAFLSTAAGVSTQGTRLKGPEAKGQAAGPSGEMRTMLPEQRGGLGTTLPKIPGAAPRGA